MSKKCVIWYFDIKYSCLCMKPLVLLITQLFKNKRADQLQSVQSAS